MPEKSGIRFDHEHWKEKLSISAMIIVAYALTIHSVVTCRFLKANYYDYPLDWTEDQRLLRPPPAFYLGLFSYDSDDVATCRSLRHDFADDYGREDDAIGWAVRLARTSGILASVVGSLVLALATVCLAFWEMKKKWWRLFQGACVAMIILQAFTFSLFWDDTCLQNNDDKDDVGDGTTTTTTTGTTMDSAGGAAASAAAQAAAAGNTDLATNAAAAQDNGGGGGGGGDGLGVECMTDIGGIVALSACLIYMFAFLSSFGIVTPVKPVVSIPYCQSLVNKNKEETEALDGRLTGSLRFSFRHFSQSMRMSVPQS